MKWSCSLKLKSNIKSVRPRKCRLEIMSDKLIRYTWSILSTVSFAILHLRFSFPAAFPRVGWIQYCGVIVFEKFRFYRPHENRVSKRVFKTLHSGERFRKVEFSVTVYTANTCGRIRKERVAFSSENGYVWTGPWGLLRKDEKIDFQAWLRVFRCKLLACSWLAWWTKLQD